MWLEQSGQGGVEGGGGSRGGGGGSTGGALYAIVGTFLSLGEPLLLNKREQNNSDLCMLCANRLEGAQWHQGGGCPAIPGGRDGSGGGEMWLTR